MITAFHIVDNTAAGPRAILNLVRHNRIRVEHLYCDTAAMKTITYERRRGRVNWTSVDRFISGDRGRLLCREGTELPAERGYRRFSSDELSLRLCENAALYLMRQIKEPHLRVVLIDDTGDHAGLCAYLSEDTDRLTVVTRDPKLYLRESDRLMEERGAVLNISQSITPFKSADLIIAPARLTRDIGCGEDAVVLSSAAPTVAQNAPVLRDYWFDLPEKYRALKPDWLDDMYYASALYTLGGAHELGSAVFRRCSDGVCIHTRMSLTELLRKRLDRAIKS